MNSYSQKTRTEIPDNYKWNLTDIYKSDADWRASKESIVKKMDEVVKFRGTLTRSASDLLRCMEYNSGIRKEANKLYLYANLNSDLDTRDMKYSGMKQELQQIFSGFAAKSAFIEPEILSADWSLIDGFIKSEPRLAPYRMELDNMFRMKKHTLSEAEERILALSGPVGGVPESVYNTFSNAEMPSPEATLSDGTKITVTKPEYSRYRASANREDRQIVFKAFWDNYDKFKASYGEMLYGNVQSHIFQAKARNYQSSLEASLYPSNIPVEVYRSLISNVDKSLPAFHRYLQIKKRMMNLDTLKYMDLYAPVVKDVDLKYSYEEASKIILEALKPMGEEYVSTVKKAIDERWIDVYPTQGKQTGAYSDGSYYDGHPFIKLNYNGLYDDVSTMAHELGHTMQSYYSNKTQPFPLADYQTFVAEVASTFNEVLLFNYMLKNEKNDDVKLSLLMNWLDGFKGTLFRQTQFAEFELKIHEAAERGEPLTGETFSKMYADIVKAYYGHDKGICKIDDYIAMEWAYIPHFYYNFYVYQYSTSFTASISLAEKVMSGDKNALNKYIEFLSSGGSDYPIDLLKKAGVDMTTSEPFEKTIQSMNKVMDEIEKILDKKSK
ncbi:MAG TPA: oligoendopeptidase F [Bacteroidales bacterium]|nr:oligoendopeptidase F [Bacteroidales bacterium]HPT03101.1 oligoendopeptidase F [Bacteroidales bacterium]